MDSVAVMTVYGNGNLQESTPERPLITFALFSYNQEKYIKDAVQSALAQDYSPLEVIISDDCSTDNTFNKIRSLVRSYDGPHRVIVRQTKKNLGTLLHVADVAEIAKGKLFVLAAGDDISKKNRVRVLQKAWLETGAWGLCSKYDSLDENGEELELDILPDVCASHRLSSYFYPADGHVFVVHGATSAYDCRIFQQLKLAPEDYILSEDGVMSFLLNALGKKVHLVEKSLVSYRECQSSLTNNNRYKQLTLRDIAQEEHKIELFATSQANRGSLFIRINDSLSSDKVRGLNIPEIRKDLCHQRTRAHWSKLGFLDRVHYLLGPAGASELKWAAPRLFGQKVFVYLKWGVQRFLKGRTPRS